MSKPWRKWYHCMCNTYGTWLPGDERGFRTRHHREHVEGDYRNPPPKGKYDARLKQSKQLLKREPVLLEWDARVAAVFAFAESLLFHQCELVDLAVTDMHLHVLARFEDWTDPRFPGNPHDDSRRYTITLDDLHNFIRNIGTPKPTDVIRGRLRGLRSIADELLPTDGITPPFHKTARRGPLPASNPNRSVRTSALDDPPRHYIGLAKKRTARLLSKAALVLTTGGLWQLRGKIKPIESRDHFQRVQRYIPNHIKEHAAVLSILMRKTG